MQQQLMNMSSSCFLFLILCLLFTTNAAAKVDEDLLVFSPLMRSVRGLLALPALPINLTDFIEHQSLSEAMGSSDYLQILIDYAKKIAPYLGPGVALGILTGASCIIYTLIAGPVACCCCCKRNKGWKKGQQRARIAVFGVFTLLVLIGCGAAVTADIEVSKWMHYADGIIDDTFDKVDDIRQTVEGVPDNLRELLSNALSLVDEVPAILSQTDPIVNKLEAVDSLLLNMSAKLSALSPQVSKTQSLLETISSMEKDCRSRINDVHNIVNNTETDITSGAKEAMAEGNATLAGFVIPSEAEDVFNQVDKAKNQTDKYTSMIFNYDKYRLIAGTVFFLFPVYLLLITVIGGLLLGKRWPLHIVVSLSLLVSFLFWGITMLGLFLTFGLTQVCDVVTPATLSTFDLPFGNATQNVTAQSLLDRCRENESILDILNLDITDINVTDLLPYDQIRQFGDYVVDQFPDTTVNGYLEELSNMTASADFPTNEEVYAIFGMDPNTLSDSMDSFNNECQQDCAVAACQGILFTYPNLTKFQLSDYAASEQQSLNASYTQMLNLRVGWMKVQSYEESLNEIRSQLHEVNSTAWEAGKEFSQFNTTFRNWVGSTINRLLGTFDNITDFVDEAFGVGKCDWVSQTFDRANSTVCGDVPAILDSLTLGCGAMALFLLPVVILNCVFMCSLPGPKPKEGDEEYEEEVGSTDSEVWSGEEELLTKPQPRYLEPPPQKPHPPLMRIKSSLVMPATIFFDKIEMNEAPPTPRQPPPPLPAGLYQPPPPRPALMYRAPPPQFPVALMDSRGFVPQPPDSPPPDFGEGSELGTISLDQPPPPQVGLGNYDWTSPSNYQIALATEQQQQQSNE